MSDPAPGRAGPATKLFTPAMLVATAAVAVLAIVVVLVAVTRDGGPSTTASGTTTTPTSATTSDPSGDSESAITSEPSGDTEDAETTTGNPQTQYDTVTNDALGMSFAYPRNHDLLDAAKWSGPEDSVVGELTIQSAVGYESCSAAAGTDLLFGFLTTSETDLQTAAESMYQEVLNNLIPDFDQSGPEDGDYVDTIDKLPGYLHSGSVTRVAKDECGNSRIQLSVFAVRNESGQVFVMLGAVRINGEIPASESEMSNLALTVFASLSVA